ncbi:MAG: YkgJ family cysteine cluster protein [Spirochaetaceae bacterium]|jgi:Fe-S-cluster containining protein|nr:YkgJ family cysteine cluster protein [Spirochaetaceae bacterium]
MDDKLFYEDGLRFSCQRCSVCCRGGPGFVFLSKTDAQGIAKSLDMPLHEFIQVYCRWVEWDDGTRLSLKEKISLDCVFWKDGCLIYEVRPIQCRTYPFWDSMLESEETWRSASAYCPGTGKGDVISKTVIESCLELDRSTPVIMKTDI